MSYLKEMLGLCVDEDLVRNFCAHEENFAEEARYLDFDFRASSNPTIKGVSINMRSDLPR
jgi:hypothetical protein